MTASLKGPTPAGALELKGQDLPATAPGGLTETVAAARLRRYGPNRIEEVRGPSLLRRLMAQFVNLFALLLWAGSGLAIVAGLPQMAAAIVAVIVLNGVFGFLQEYRAEREVAELKRLLPQQAVAVRGGTERRIAVEELVPGDLVILAEGDRVSADARLVQSSDLRLDESSLSGESHPVHKSAEPETPPAADPLSSPGTVFAGTAVVTGAGMAVVTATGLGTEFGRIARLTQSVPRAQSPLEKEVASVARRVAVLSVVMGAGFFAIGHVVAGLGLKEGAVFAIGIVLGNVPEGLLPTMTLALAMGVRRMARRGAVVKRLSSVETLGSCTVICTDKTGTITRNQMTVTEIWASRRRVAVTGTGYEPSGEFLHDGHPLSDGERAAILPALRIGSLCNTARLTDSQGAWQVLGDPTEGALLVAAAKAGLNRELDERLRPIVRTLAFDARRKRMSTVHRALAQHGPLVAYVKGAPKELLEHCSSTLVDGQELPLTDQMRDEAIAENDRMARGGMRVLGMAYGYLQAEDAAQPGALDPDRVERRLVFAGLVGMEDPPREEVARAVARCRGAGIRVIMITGDYGLTAEAIARQVGLLEPGPCRLVEGAELDAMDDDGLRDLVGQQRALFARATPEHKLRIVSGLIARGEVVAVTGDGVNDAPALKRADIGVAMGISGTDVAREAADVVLLDDNFATIVNAVEEGRAIFDNMRKFIVYIFAHLSPEAIPFIFFAVFRVPLPLTVMQILAIDLGTETLPALALGLERPEPDVMTRPPRSSSQRLLGAGALLRGYGYLGLLTSAVVMLAFFLFLRSQGWSWGQPQAPTPLAGRELTAIVFLGIVLMQVANGFACRTERTSVFAIGLFSNRWLLWGVAFELALAAAVIYVPFLQPLFSTGPVPPQWWLLFIVFLPLVFFAEQLRKAMARRWGNA
jgi:magnesium-transporting ATPase (P-type)